MKEAAIIYTCMHHITNPVTSRIRNNTFALILMYYKCRHVSKPGDVIIERHHTHARYGDSFILHFCSLIGAPTECERTIVKGVL